MKLNFWQWIGLVLLLVGLTWLLYREFVQEKKPAPNPAPGAGMWVVPS